MAIMSTNSPPSSTGLDYVAILNPTRRDLADALQRLKQAGMPLKGAADHGVGEALYPIDPGGNGVALSWDRPKENWSRNPEGELNMATGRLDLTGPLAELR